LTHRFKRKANVFGVVLHKMPDYVAAVMLHLCDLVLLVHTV